MWPKVVRGWVWEGGELQVWEGDISSWGGNIPGFPPPPDKTLHGLAKLSIMQSYLVT